MIQRQKDRKITVSSLKFMRLKIGVVMALFNTDITEKLLQGALKELDALGVREENIILLQVPGSFEIPLAVKALILDHQPDAVVCLGALIKGETDHYEIVKNISMNEIKIMERIFHQKFGYGEVSEIDGDKVTVEFEKAGQKKLLLSFIEKI